MREITSHQVNGLNEALEIKVADAPGSGGANHRYEIRGFNTAGNPSRLQQVPWDDLGATSDHVVILFQNGPIKEAGFNGISQEALLAIVADRLQCFQAGPYATADNAEALASVNHAIEVLHRRTKERMARGVEGTHQK